MNPGYCGVREILTCKNENEYRKVEAVVKEKVYSLPQRTSLSSSFPHTALRATIHLFIIIFLINEA